MFKPNSLRSLVLGASILAAAAPASAGAETRIVSGNAALTVIIPDVIILDYFTSINLTQCALVENQNGSMVLLSKNKEVKPSHGRNTDPHAGNINNARSTAFNASDVTLTMKQVWAVRGFPTNGNATVSVIGPGTLSISSTSGVSNRQAASDGTPESASGNSVTASLNGIRKEDATTGDVLISRNFANNSGSITIMVVKM